MMFKCQITLLFLLLISGAALGQTLSLFKDGEQVSNYRSLINSIQSGDIVQFENNKKFTIGKILSNGTKGNTTFIAEIEGEEKIIRLPLSDGYFISGDKHSRPATYMQIMAMFYNGYTMLAKAGVPVPHVYLEESIPGQYLIVEKVNIKYNLSAFLGTGIYKILSRTNDPEIQDKYRKIIRDIDIDREVAREKLLEFVAKTYMFTTIDDFSSSNLVWNGKEWLLIDFMGGADRYYKPKDSNIFSNIAFSDINLRKQIDETIVSLRMAEKNKTSCFGRIFSFLQSKGNGRSPLPAH